MLAAAGATVSETARERETFRFVASERLSYIDRGPTALLYAVLWPGQLHILLTVVCLLQLRSLSPLRVCEQ